MKLAVPTLRYGLISTTGSGLAQPIERMVPASQSGRRKGWILAGYKCPKDLIVVEKVRRSPAGKQDYSWAKKVALGDHSPG